MLPSCLRDSFSVLSSDRTTRCLSPVGLLNPNMAQRDLRHDSHAALDWVTPQLVLLRKDKGNRNKSLLHRSPSRLIPTLPRPQTNPLTLTACCVTVLVCQHVCVNTSVSTRLCQQVAAIVILCDGVRSLSSVLIAAKDQ